MRRTGCKVKRFLVALLAASLILPHGAMSAWAEGTALNQPTAIEETAASAEEETLISAEAEEETLISAESKGESSEAMLTGTESESSEEYLAEATEEASDAVLDDVEDETETESSQAVLNDIEDAAPLQDKTLKPAPETETASDTEQSWKTKLRSPKLRLRRHRLRR